ncbi:MAG TPA: thiamine phosphate synthase [Solirubrobacteraceae bacterium]|jgi:thiamine-phosphate pyrophosphorylase|nr:thiamine phosphate synthase [Solirubrobacteraceae bacterium]
MAHLRPVPDPNGEQRRARLAAARLYLVCDCMPGERDLSEFLAEAIAGGVDVVQLREKHLEDEFLAEAASVAADVCDACGALFILNDRPDIAAEVRADGVHIGQQDMPVAEARAIVGPEMLVGLSTHAPSEIDAATPVAPDGSLYVDYIGVGPVHATPTKLGRPPVGPELVNYASAHAHVPFFAIGGIDSENILGVLDAGADRVCVLRAICDARDPEQAALTLRGALERRPLLDGDRASGSLDIT